MYYKWRGKILFFLDSHKENITLDFSVTVSVILLFK